MAWHTLCSSYECYHILIKSTYLMEKGCFCDESNRKSEVEAGKMAEVKASRTVGCIEVYLNYKFVT
jgi:hypothetical protein